MSSSVVPVPRLHPFRATLAAVCAIGIGLGMSRYAYTPLIPALIRDGWVSVPQAGFLGGSNLHGLSRKLSSGHCLASISFDSFCDSFVIGDCADWCVDVCF